MGRLVIMRFDMEQKLREINYLFRWSQLKVLQKNKIVKTSYIWLLVVPFITKLFSKTSDNIYELDLILPFSWKVFFISALFFTLANLLFSIFAPRIVKEYQDYGDFKLQGKTYNELTDYFSKYEHGNSMMRIVNNEGQQEPNELFWDMYNFRDKEHNTVHRYITSTLYLIGLLLALFVFIQSIFWVLLSWF